MKKQRDCTSADIVQYTVKTFAQCHSRSQILITTVDFIQKYSHIYDGSFIVQLHATTVIKKILKSAAKNKKKYNTFTKQDNVHTNMESVQCILIVYSIWPYKYNQ